MTDVPGETKD